MGASDWTVFFSSAEVLVDAYESPPPLSECTIVYAQIDERDASLTLSCETSVLPSNPPAEWAGTDYNTVEFFLKFSGVADLRISGWDWTVRDAEIALSRCAEGVRVSVVSASSRLDLVAAQACVLRMRSYLAARE
ncbi:Imm50 family immunity protein [Streptomyces sp. NPDC015131]|uniref:Imm50 family immunity protein n=1 Tax=Streptomyces sp. NPDC015131 TaxID=3364941 RepID=UPI0036FFCDA7